MSYLNFQGIGNLEDSKTTDFYTLIGTHAKTTSTTISIIGIEGTDCGVSELGICADMSNGTVNVVNPLELQRQMRMIIDNPILCTDVKIKCFVSQGCVVRGEEDVECMVKDVGSITSEADFSIELGVKENVKNVNVQFQIEFTKRDKSKYIRVINTEFKTTNDRDLAVKKKLKIAAIDVFLGKRGAMCSNGITCSAKFSQNGTTRQLQYGQK